LVFFTCCWAIIVAEAIVQALQTSSADNRVFAVASVEGEGPGQDQANWEKLFNACYSTSKSDKATVAV
jgi:hypothetical protein